MFSKSRQLQTACWSLAVSLSLVIVLLALRPDLGDSLVALYRSIGNERSASPDRFVDVPTAEPIDAAEPSPTGDSDRTDAVAAQSADEHLFPETVVSQIRLEPIPAADDTAAAADESIDAASSAADAVLDARLAALQQTAELLARAAAADRQSDESERAERRLEQMRQEIRLRELEQQIARLKSAAMAAQPVKTPARIAATSTAVKRTTQKSEAEERYSLHILNSEITDVLEWLGRKTGRNILIGSDVTGIVPSANLDDVTLEEALDAIVRSLGLEFEVRDETIYVMTADEHQTRPKAEGTAGKRAEFLPPAKRLAGRSADSGEPPVLQLPPLPPAESSAENR